MSFISDMDDEKIAKQLPSGATATMSSSLTGTGTGTSTHPTIYALLASGEPILWIPHSPRCYVRTSNKEIAAYMGYHRLMNKHAQTR